MDKNEQRELVERLGRFGMTDEDLTTPEAELHDPVRLAGEALAASWTAAHGGRSKLDLYDLWLTPIKPALEITKGTADKPLAELTMPEVLSWLMVVGYGAATGYLIGKVAASVILGPVNRRPIL